MIGPECVAQHRKFVASKMRNWGERSACAPRHLRWPLRPRRPQPPARSPSPADGAPAATTGIMMAATTTAITCIEVRQSWVRDQPGGKRRHDQRRHPHAGRNQRHREAAMGIEPAGDARHHRRKDRRRSSRRPAARTGSETTAATIARLASARLAASTIDPVSTTGTPSSRADTADRRRGGSTTRLATDSETATWQLACLPNWPQYWCDTPDRVRPALGEARVVDDPGLDRSVPIHLRRRKETAHLAEHLLVGPVALGEEVQQGSDASRRSRWEPSPPRSALRSSSRNPRSSPEQ